MTAVVLFSLEPWDEVRRRNQHLATALVSAGVIGSLVFVEPPEPGLSVRARRRSPAPGIEVVTPPLIVPRRVGGHRVLARWMRGVAADADVLWVNDPVAGASALRAGLPAVYDVTDDWRSLDQPAADRARTVAAEDRLAARATTVVCSEVLAARWRSRYGVDPVVIPNGVDTEALRSAQRMDLPGSGPHAVYVGTVHANRVDVDLVEALAKGEGTVHLVGPNGLDAAAVERLTARGVQLHGPVPWTDVPAWLVSADVLVCPHIVDEFTLSLDAIKAHEYLATDRPVVATPSCGFQSLTADGLTVVGRGQFVAATVAALRTGPFDRLEPPSWQDRARQFAAVLNQPGGAELSR